MGRPKQNKVRLEFRLDPEDREKLAKMLVELGYIYGGAHGWTAFMDAIARGEIILYKKVS